MNTKDLLLSLTVVIAASCSQRSQAPKLMDIQLGAVKITAIEPEKASLEGRILYSQDPAATTLLISDEGARVSLNEDGTFTIEAIGRSAQDKPLEITASAPEYKSKTCKLTIPGTADFRVADTRIVSNQDNPYIDVIFSQALDETANLYGLVRLSGVGRYYFTIEDNRLRIFYEDLGTKLLSLEIENGIQSSEGQTLEKKFETEFSSSEKNPQVEFVSKGCIVPEASQLKIPFKAQNLWAVDFSVVRIYEDNILGFLQDNDLSEDDYLRRSGRLIAKGTLRLDQDKSLDLKQSNGFTLDLTRTIKEEPGAIYRVNLSFSKEYSLYNKDVRSIPNSPKTSFQTPSEEDEAVWDQAEAWYYEDRYNWREYNWEERDDPSKASYYMQSFCSQSINILSSDIGLIAKSAGNGKIWIAAADLLTAEPLAGASIEVFDFQRQKIGNGRTSRDGLVRIETTHKPFAVVARKGKRKAYLKVTEGTQKALGRFDVGGATVTKGLNGFVYSERGVWRPGDTLHLSLMVFDRNKSVPNNHPVTLEIYSPQGQFYHKAVNSEGTDGIYCFEVPTSAGDPTGSYNAYFKLGGATFHKSLPIETIKPNRLKIDAKIAPLSSGKASSVEISSSWLTGIPAAALKASIEMSLSPSTKSLKKGYIFSDPTKTFDGKTIAFDCGTLDSKGHLRTSLTPPAAKDAPGLLRANIVTKVFEPGGDASINSSAVDYSPYSAYVGLKFPGGENNCYETDKDLCFKVLVLDQNARKVLGHTLEYSIYKLSWSWWWENRSEDFDSFVNSSCAEPVEEGFLQAADGTAELSFKVEYPDWGRFLVLVKDPLSGHASGGIIYVNYPQWRGRSDKEDPDGVALLSFSTDKQSYKVGETMSVFIPAPVGSHALVSLENGSEVLSESFVEGQGDQTLFKAKISEQMAPNFYVHVSLLQPHSQTANNLPIRMYGVRNINVSNEHTHLQPVIGVPSQVQPQEPFNIKVSEASGKSMSYTIAIVDEGLLDITSFKTPDPWKTMYAKEALGVRTWDLYDYVAGAFTGRFSPLSATGGDENISKDKVKESRFNPVVKFLGPFTLKKGTAVHSVKLPMYVGSVRVMVVAGSSEGLFGKAERSLPVRSPLMILPTAPRSLGCGESTTIPVNVFTSEQTEGPVTIRASVQGPGRIIGEPAFTIAGSGVVRFNIKASPEKEGTLQVNISATAGKKTVKERIALDVSNPNPVVVTSESKMISAGETVNMIWNSTGSLSAELSLSGFPTLDLNGAFKFVRDYPYLCTEQLSSRGIFLVYALDLLPEKDAETARQLIPGILRHLYSRQLPDGGFAYWDSDSVPNEWASSLAGQLLSEAAARGFEVEAGVLGRWRSFQRKCSTDFRSESGDALTQAYRLYTLALAGDADEAAMNRLKALENLPARAAWRLAAAYALCGKKTVSQDLIRTLDTSCTGSDPRTFGSPLRDKAMMMESLLLSGDLSGAVEQCRDVAQGISAEGFTTQTAAWCCVAVSRLSKLMDKGILESEIDGVPLKNASGFYSTSLKTSKARISISNRGKGPIYACISTGSKPAFGTITESSSRGGLKVERSFVDMSGGSLSVGSLEQGTSFYEKIEVVNSSLLALKNLALSAALPSGWEVFNERIYGYSSYADSPCEYKDVRDSRVDWFFDLGAGESKTFYIRLQASYEGSYVLPSVSCTAMYDPHVAAYSESALTRVSRPTGGTDARF